MFAAARRGGLQFVFVDIKDAEGTQRGHESWHQHTWRSRVEQNAKDGELLDFV